MKTAKGFTLIELLIVIAIVGIIAATFVRGPLMGHHHGWVSSDEH